MEIRVLSRFGFMVGYWNKSATSRSIFLKDHLLFPRNTHSYFIFLGWIQLLELRWQLPWPLVEVLVLSTIIALKRSKLLKSQKWKNINMVRTICTTFFTHAPIIVRIMYFHNDVSRWSFGPEPFIWESYVIIRHLAEQ